MHVWTAPAGDDQRSSARDLLLELAGVLLGRTAELRYEDSGRPYVDGLAVSISHSLRLVAVAASAIGPVGVDVEDVYQRPVAGLARRWFDPSELSWMRTQADPLTAFLQLWTAKEAVGKALGHGLRSGGLRRRMPLGGGRVESEPDLFVTHMPLEADLPHQEGAVLTVALPATAAEVLLIQHHGAALRRTVRSRTSFPVVVRGS